MISTVLFDMGGTLEETVHSEETELDCGTQVLAYLKKQGIDIDMSPEEFMKIAGPRHREYRVWADKTFRELMPYEVWSEWKLKGFRLDQDKLRAISEGVSCLWDITYYKRNLRPDSIKLLDALRSSGYLMGIISNTPSLTQVYKMLDKYGIRDYFEIITLSSICGYKKPNRILFDITLADMNVEPSEAVYVGDTISRDVLGARNAGLAMNIRINSDLTEMSDYNIKPDDTDADYVIKNLIEVYEILENYNKKAGV
jgi:putative hydrolase of the HAD superfamily